MYCKIKAGHAHGISGWMLATASYDHTTRIWDVQSGAELQRLNHDSIVTSVAFSPD
jgi:WD40 repeat protein